MASRILHTRTGAITGAPQYGGNVIWDSTTVTGMTLEWEDLQVLIDIDKRHRRTIGKSGRDLLVVWRKVDEAMGKIHAQLSKTSPRPRQCFSFPYGCLDEFVLQLIPWESGRAKRKIRWPVRLLV